MHNVLLLYILHTTRSRSVAVVKKRKVKKKQKNDFHSRLYVCAPLIGHYTLFEIH